MNGEPGTIYLLHYAAAIGNPASKYGTAQHYTGWARNLPARLTHHARGTAGVPITAAFAAAGIGFQLARTWPGDRTRERRIKNQGGASRHCPLCKTGGPR
jgi:hypothetical protein